MKDEQEIRKDERQKVLAAVQRDIQAWRETAIGRQYAEDN